MTPTTETIDGIISFQDAMDELRAAVANGEIGIYNARLRLAVAFRELIEVNPELGQLLLEAFPGGNSFSHGNGEVF